MLGCHDYEPPHDRKLTDRTKRDYIHPSVVEICHTVTPINPIIGVHISYSHLNCLMLQLFGDPRDQTVPYLDAKGEQVGHGDGRYTCIDWENTLYHLDGAFYQRQKVVYRRQLSAKGKTFRFQDKFESCPHTGLLLSRMKITNADARGYLIPTAMVCPSHEFNKWRSQRDGDYAEEFGCEVCEADTVVHIGVSDGHLIVAYECYRKLGVGGDIAVDDCWRTLMTGIGIPRRFRYDLSDKTKICQFLQSEKESKAGLLSAALPSSDTPESPPEYSPS